MDLKAMKALALELNDVLGIDPAIKTAGVSLPDLQKKVEEAIALVDFEEDVFTPETMKAFAELGYDTGVEVEEEEVEEEVPVKKASATKAKMKVVEPEPEEDDEDEEDEPAPKKKAAKKPVEVEEDGDDFKAQVEDADLDELKALIKEEDVLEPLRKGLALQKNVDKLRVRALELLDTPAPVKKAENKVVSAESVKGKGVVPANRVTTAERVEYMTPLIAKGTYSKKELLEMMCKKFPQVTKAANQTILTDGKNPKYNKFAKLIVQDADGLMSFSKKK